MKKLLLLAFVGMLGCRERPPVSGCTPNTTRCDANRAQLCVMSQRWETVTDCRTVTPGVHTCREENVNGRTLHACVPAQETAR